LQRWWRLVLNQGSADRENHLQVIIYTLWNIWKERCTRVFQQIGINADQVPALSRQDVLTYRVANTTVQ
jgi:tRNA(His) 5'-end guanylyltransferase